MQLPPAAVPGGLQVAAVSAKQLSSRAGQAPLSLAVPLMAPAPPAAHFLCVQSMLLAIGTCTLNWLFTGFTR